MDWGIENRLSRLIEEDGRCQFLPIDHGYFQGPMPMASLLPEVYYDHLFPPTAKRQLS